MITNFNADNFPKELLDKGGLADSFIPTLFNTLGWEFLGVSILASVAAGKNKKVSIIPLEVISAETGRAILFSKFREKTIIAPHQKILQADQPYKRNVAHVGRLHISGTLAKLTSPVDKEIKTFSDPELKQHMINILSTLLQTHGLIKSLNEY